MCGTLAKEKISAAVSQFQEPLAHSLCQGQILFQSLSGTRFRLKSFRIGSHATRETKTCLFQIVRADLPPSSFAAPALSETPAPVLFRTLSWGLRPEAPCSFTPYRRVRLLEEEGMFSMDLYLATVLREMSTPSSLLSTLAMASSLKGLLLCSS